MNKAFLEARIKEHFGTKTEFAKSLGIQLGSVTDWFSRDVIPTAKIAEVFEKLKIETEEEVETALNLPKLEVCYRAKKKDLLEKDVPKDAQSSIKRFSKIYFGIKGNEKPSSDISEVRSRIGKNRNALEVASIIRQFLDLTERTPFNLSSIQFILKKYGIDVFFVPFDSFNFNSKDGIQPLAFTSRKEDKYLILCDSNRTYDEAHFDLTHELVHVFTDLVSGKPDNTTEKFIDAVTEELIYPKSFLEREFPFIKDADKGRITAQDFLKHNLREMIANSDFMAPRGLAKRLLSLGYLSDRQQAYLWLHNEEHEFYLKHYGTPLTVRGKMNLDFADADELMKFMSETAMVDQAKYPLFADLYNALVEGRISARSFADVFGLDSGEADEVRLAWIKQSKKS